MMFATAQIPESLRDLYGKESMRNTKKLQENIALIMVLEALRTNYRKLDPLQPKRGTCFSPEPN